MGFSASAIVMVLYRICLLLFSWKFILTVIFFHWTLHLKNDCIIMFIFYQGMKTLPHAMWINDFTFYKSTESSAESYGNHCWCNIATIVYVSWQPLLMSHGNHCWCLIYNRLCLGDVSQMDDCFSQGCNNSEMMLIHLPFIAHHRE